MSNVKPHSLFSDYDIYLFRSGNHFRIYENLGSFPMTVDGEKGVHFAVWAPNARYVSVIGGFNDWNPKSHKLFPRLDESGIWEGFIPGMQKGANYKYRIKSNTGQALDKGDPYARLWEVPSDTASIVWDFNYKWKDDKWMENRSANTGFSVYEVHLGSWKKKNNNDESLTYREMARELVPYVKKMGFTHVELMPVMEHPYFHSWGYQITGYYAPTHRFGKPEDLMYLIDKFHQAGLGVILDWVPSHFPTDGHGPGWFDGTHLYEHPDPQKGFHPDWQSFIFDYGRNEVRNFLFSNAMFWLEYFHADGLRVDAVASMIHLDYSREEGQWTPNKFGGNGYLEAIDFVKELNMAVHREYPGVAMIAEESTDFPGVTREVQWDGLGFDQKWMMGWMNDTLEYFKIDPIFRKHHQNKITFSFTYAFSEKYMLPLSHDEVVHGKGTLFTRMPGDEGQRYANLRLLFGMQWMHPGSNLIFMGGEFAQTTEWNIEVGLEWHLLQYDYHKGVQQWVQALNEFYKKEPALSLHQFDYRSFEWIDGTDHKQSVVSYIRKTEEEKDTLVIVCNFTPVVRRGYKIGVPHAGNWKEVLNSTDEAYAGYGMDSNGTVEALEETQHGRPYCIELDLPALSIMVFKNQPVKKSKSRTKKKA